MLCINSYCPCKSTINYTSLLRLDGSKWLTRHQILYHQIWISGSTKDVLNSVVARSLLYQVGCSIILNYCQGVSSVLLDQASILLGNINRKASTVVSETKSSKGRFSAITHTKQQTPNCFWSISSKTLPGLYRA